MNKIYEYVIVSLLAVVMVQQANVLVLSRQESRTIIKHETVTVTNAFSLNMQALNDAYSTGAENMQGFFIRSYIKQFPATIELERTVKDHFKFQDEMKRKYGAQ